MPSIVKTAVIIALANWRAHQNASSQDLWRFVTSLLTAASCVCVWRSQCPWLWRAGW